MKLRFVKTVVCFGFLMSWLGNLAVAASGADILLANFSPRAIALGGAYIALAEDVTSLQYNPAGLGRLQGTQVAFSHQAGLVDTSELFAFSKPLKIGGAIGASLLWRSLPEIDNPGAIDPPAKSNDILISIGYGREFGLAQKGVRDFSAGITLQWLRSTLDTYEVTHMSADAGVWWRPDAFKYIQVGLVVKNLGTPLRYQEESDPMPILGGLGIVGNIYQDAFHSFKCLADYSTTADYFQIHSGIEYWYNNLLALRFGYQYEPGSLVTGIQGGVGVQVISGLIALQMDYAFKPMNWFENQTDIQHWFGLLIGF